MSGTKLVETPPAPAPEAEIVAEPSVIVEPTLKDIADISGLARLKINHVMYDGYEGDRRDLEDMLDLHDMTKEITQRLGLQQVNPALLFPYFDGKVPEDCGISGMAIVPGGHLTVHTFSHRTRRMVFADMAFVEPETPESEAIVGKSKKKMPDSGKLFRKQLRGQFRTNSDEIFARGEKPTEDIDLINHSFGPHLTLEGTLPESERTIGWVYDFLNKIPAAIGMTPITQPYVTKKDGWIDGILLIAESHISIHIEESTGRYYFDIFSCKNFDVPKVLDLIRQNGLNFDESTKTLTARGKRFPRP